MPVTLTSAEILVLYRVRTKISAEVRVTGIEVGVKGIAAALAFDGHKTLGCQESLDCLQFCCKHYLFLSWMVNTYVFGPKLLLEKNSM